MSPILVRPVREQFEHDRVIRVLQARYKRKYEVVINPGAEQNAPVTAGDLTMYPDLVLFSPERGRKMQGTVEVETTESVNTLEAMAEWGPFSRLRVPLFLYVPANTIDSVRRLCADLGIAPAEIWTFHTAIDQVRFTMVHRAPDAPAPRAEARPKPEPAEKSDKAEKPKAARKTPPTRGVKAVKTKKGSAAKKSPRATAARPRPAAKKSAKKSTVKRAAPAKR